MRNREAAGRPDLRPPAERADFVLADLGTLPECLAAL